MELSDSFTVACPIDETWALLTEPERVARCVPGAHLTEIVGDDHHGVVNVRLCSPLVPVTLGLHDDPVPVEVVFERGVTGEAGRKHTEAHITARLEALSDDQTQVNVDADLQLDGRLAQLGRGIITEVSSALTAQFGDNLAASTTAERVLGPDAFAHPRSVAMPEPDALDLLDTARRPIMKRLVPLAGLVTLVVWLVRGRRSGR